MHSDSQVKSTDELLKILTEIHTEQQLKNYSSILIHSSFLPSFASYLNQKMTDRGITPASLIQNAGIQRNYGYQILSGQKNPSRDKIIALCLALQLSLDDTQRALTLAQEGTLYPRNHRDSILIFAINESLSVLKANELLCELNHSPLA